MDYAINDTFVGSTAALLESLGAETDSLKAVWFAYPMAQLVTPDHFGDELTVKAPSVRTFDGTSCMADALLTIVTELRDINECVCTFGHEGTFQILAILGDICTKKGKPGDLALLRDIAPVMAKHAICEEGKAVARAVTQVLDAFNDEIEAHITKKVCAAGGCRAFQTYHVLVSKCIGCGKCLEVCDDDAILGKPRFVHVIVQKACVQCDKCREACPEGAIVTAGANKPKTPPKPIPCKRK